MKQVAAFLESVGGFNLFVHDANDTFISAEIARHGVWEKFETELMMRFATDGGAVVDVGANLGWYSVVAALHIGSKGRVLAIEPEPANYALLCANIELNNLPNVTSVMAAVGETEQIVSLSLSSENRGDHRVGSALNLRDTVQVQQRPLAAICADAGLRAETVSILKVDIQGGETGLLRASCDFLSRIPSASGIFIEFSPVLLGEDREAFVDLVEALGRRIYLVDQSQRLLIPTTPRKLRRLGRRIIADAPFEDFGLDLLLTNNRAVPSSFRTFKGEVQRWKGELAAILDPWGRRQRAASR